MLESHPEIKVRAFPAKVMKALAKETRSQLQQLITSSKVPLTKEIINSQLSYQRQTRQWTRFGDQAYLNNTFLIVCILDMKSTLYVGKLYTS